MGDFNSKGLGEATQYVALAAASTGILGSQNAYLEKMIVIPNTTGAQGITLSDGTTAIATIPTAAHAIDPHPYTVHYGIRATGAGFKVVTGTSVSCVAVGWFGAVPLTTA